MAKISPWHSIAAEDPPVYHDNDKCTEGDNILRKNRQPGTDDRRRCKKCEDLARQGK